MNLGTCQEELQEAVKLRSKRGKHRRERRRRRIHHCRRRQQQPPRAGEILKALESRR